MKRKNQKSKELNSSSKILVHLERNVIVQLEVQKKIGKVKIQKCEDKKRKNNAFIKMCIV